MPKLTEAQLLTRDAGRDLNGELLESIRELQAGNVGRVSVVTRDGRVIESPASIKIPATWVRRVRSQAILA
jgi:hypothetical protein